MSSGAGTEKRKAYHISDKTGPGTCDATKRNCPFGAERHFDTLTEAEAVWSKELVDTYSEASVMTAESSHIPAGVQFDDEDLQQLNDEFEAADMDSILELAEDPIKHAQLDQVIRQRAESARIQLRNIEFLDSHTGKDKPVSFDTLKALRATLNSYRDETARMVEAHSESSLYDPLVKDADMTHLGNAIIAHTYPQNDRRWYTTRHNTMGGSDVAAIAKKHFTDPEEWESRKCYYDRLSYARTTDAKTKGYSEEEISDRINKAGSSGRNGAAYRGSMWETRIRDDYAKDNPGVTLLNVKDQFRSPADPRQQVNVDGVIVNKETNEPEGLLEIKTAADTRFQWKDSVPLGYRAQVLYYLEVTGLKYADVRVLVNDSETKQFRLNRDDEVAPGSGVTMKQFLKDTVMPWMDEAQAKRRELQSA